MTDWIDRFIDRLAAAEVAEDAFNQYALDDGINAVRRENFRLYLHQMAAREPRVLLVGEAPGYQGCRRCGVPFTSDYILLNPPEGVPIFGAEAGYRMSPEYDKPRKEPSATIVWTTIGQTELLPVIFSAYPFHPFKKGKPLSNRAPRAAELAQGREFLAEMLTLFPFEAVLAVGNNAEKSLQALDVPYVKLRHPSHGGKAEFVAGFEAVARQFT
ncbi:MAG: uracil-DNA glycosylase [Anaerolineae bacterium]